MINLSDFNKNIKVDLVTGEKESRFSGDFEFYTLNEKRFVKINECIQKIDNKTSDLEVAYIILPYICSINVDITLEQFEEMNDYSPCSEFTEFMLSLTDYLKDLLEQINKIKKIKLKSEQLLKDYPILQKANAETTEEKILRLENEFEKEKDRKKKILISSELTKLYNEVEKNE